MCPSRLSILTPLALWLAAAALPASASSTASSLASEGASASVGSVSTSIEKSSQSSSGDRRAAAGDYRVVALAPAAGRDGMVRVDLEPVDPATAAARFALVLPGPTAVQAALAPGQRVQVREREYGVEFARDGAAFFLVLDDAWHRELQTRVVAL